jgi:hypothetical protein
MSNLTPAPLHVPFLFMSFPAEIAERHSRTLCRLTEAGERLALRLAERAEAAESEEAAERLALAFHRVYRGVRMGLALEMKLAQERLKLEREARACRAETGQARKKLVRAELLRTLPPETSRNERFEIDLEIAERLESEDLELLGEGSFQAHVARLREEMGLTADDAANDESEPAAAEALAREGARPGPGPADPPVHDLTIPTPAARAGPS